MSGGTIRAAAGDEHGAAGSRYYGATKEERA
jgi:hypothetical protein